MKENAFWCVLGFVLGAFTGGYVVGTQCAKKHQRVVEDLQDEIDDLLEERSESDCRGLSEPLRGLTEGRSNKRSDESDENDDIFDEDYDFNDPFDDEDRGNKAKHIVIKDLKTGAEMKFSSYSAMLDCMDFKHACETGELLAKTASGDMDAYRKLNERYRSESIDKFVGNKDHPHDSGEDDYDPDDIYLIDPQTFKKEILYRDDETITYYQQDGVLINSADQLIDNKERTIGLEALDIIDKTEADYLYVDNQVENKVYEICIEHRYSYYKDIVGSSISEDAVIV